MNHQPPKPKKLIVAIFNYNNNENAQRLKEIFQPYFPTYIFDSGSSPECPNAIHYENIYYGGMLNELIKKGKNYEWCCLITSDVEIADEMVKAIPERMMQVWNNPQAGNYQPSCVHQGRSHDYGYNKSTGNFRSVPYFEGWFQMFRTSLGFSVDLSLNRIGWGTDLYLCKRARNKGLINIVDDAVAVLHPRETGFSNYEANQQMLAWKATLPDFENQIKTGIGIICYEGTEHLREIIEEIRDEVDHIVLLWSDKSYMGKDCDPMDKDETDRLILDGLVDNIIEFPVISYVPPREQETIRRNQGLAYFQSIGIDYALIMDSDEFYHKKEFHSAKEVVRQWLPQATYCYYKNYYKYKNCELQDDCFPTPRVVPFLCHTSQRFKFDIPFANPSDPTRRMWTHCNIFFQKEQITMRHWSWIRKDIRKKILNWSSIDVFPKHEIDEMIDYFEKFDVNQTVTRIPHKILKNKVGVKFDEDGRNEDTRI